MLIDIRGCYGTLIRVASTRKLVETAQTLMYVCSGYRTCVCVWRGGGEADQSTSTSTEVNLRSYTFTSI